MAIKSLTAHEQAVILLFYMEEKSIKEIMDIMEMPSGTVRSCLSRGRQALLLALTDIAICAAIFLVGHLLLPATASSSALQFLITWRYLLLGLMSLSVVCMSFKNA